MTRGGEIDTTLIAVLQVIEAFETSSFSAPRPSIGASNTTTVIRAAARRRLFLRLRQLWVPAGVAGRRTKARVRATEFWAKALRIMRLPPLVCSCAATRSGARWLQASQRGADALGLEVLSLRQRVQEIGRASCRE